jgi:hypothetical protein
MIMDSPVCGVMLSRNMTRGMNKWVRAVMPPLGFRGTRRFVKNSEATFTVRSSRSAGGVGNSLIGWLAPLPTFA